jgi:hypothetical protein
MDRKVTAELPSLTKFPSTHDLFIRRRGKRQFKPISHIKEYMYPSYQNKIERFDTRDILQ